ncbi:MAG: hypothetical protein AB8B87_15755 [Granulosicoccus sp.]
MNMINTLALVVLSSLALSFSHSAVVVEYEIGGKGPAGGIVFYVTEDRSHGLEAAPVVLGSAPWGCSESSIVGGTHTSLGSGKLNTQLIVNQCGEGTAAALANNYAGGGYIDWYLPSKGELSLMYKNLAELGAGNYAGGNYWSSSEYEFGNSYAWVNDFGVILQIEDVKSEEVGVRAVRAF